MKMKTNNKFIQKSFIYDDEYSVFEYSSSLAIAKDILQFIENKESSGLKFVEHKFPYNGKNGLLVFK